MTRYRHTQSGTLTRIALGAALLMVAFVVFMARGQPLATLVCGLVALVLVGCLRVFHSLTVEVDEREVRIRFGSSRFGKEFPLAEIESAASVRNRWFYGWGIRWYLRGWLFNVSGLDAVELTMRDGRLYRLGTDEPARLERAIREAAALDDH